jgi:protein-L-isoaspartate(D-aspartate) O-methyltransferase
VRSNLSGSEIALGKPGSQKFMVAPPIPSNEATAKMLELLELKPTDILMEIGTGTGSQTAEWQRYCAEVHTVELRQEYKLDDSLLGPHVYVSCSDGAEGLADAAPFDAIVATCGVAEIPAAWKDQLKDGGRLVVPIGHPESQKLTLFRKINDELTPERVAAYTRFVMMEKT